MIELLCDLRGSVNLSEPRSFHLRNSDHEAAFPAGMLRRWVLSAPFGCSFHDCLMICSSVQTRMVLFRAKHIHRSQLSIALEVIPFG